MSVGALLDKFETADVPTDRIEMRVGACVPGGTGSVRKKIIKNLVRGSRAPIFVRPVGDKYELVAGDTEFLAARKQGQVAVRVFLSALDDKDALFLRLHEGGQRRDLNAVEEAEIIRELNVEHGLTQQEIAVRCDRVQSTIANKLRLLSLPSEILASLRKGEIGERHARALLKLKDRDKQMEAFQRLMRWGLSAKDVESLCSVLTGDKSRRNTKRTTQGAVKDPRIYQNALRSVVREMQKAGLEAVCEENVTHDKWEFRVTVDVTDF